MKIILFFHVLGCSGMFQNVPVCSVFLVLSTPEKYRIHLCLPPAKWLMCGVFMFLCGTNERGSLAEFYYRLAFSEKISQSKIVLKEFNAA